MSATDLRDAFLRDALGNAALRNDVYVRQELGLLAILESFDGI